MYIARRPSARISAKDRYGRTIADVILPDGVNLNQKLVKQGWCWWYRKYAPGDAVLEGLEQEARKAKRGLWADTNPAPPWKWRQHRTKTRFTQRDLASGF